MHEEPPWASLPKLDGVLEDARLAGLPRGACVTEARAVLEALRAAWRAGEALPVPDVAAVVAPRVRSLLAGQVRPVINATGVVVHTNLGRAPWGSGARAHALDAMGYCSVELDRERGARGGRLSGVRSLLAALVGAPDVLVVNNGAAAVLLALSAVAAGREVVVSRGELVEIGGSFRVPDVIAAGGARLREVGTTNRTRVADYAAALGPETGALLKVHPSNFKQLGFVAEASREELVGLAQARGLVVVEDLGSGALWGHGAEPSVAAAVAAGVSLCCFSADKLLGGPQAGVIVGAPELISKLAAHPLYRALRVDKVCLAALEGTLADWLAGVEVPVAAALSVTEAVLEARGRALLGLLAEQGVAAELLPVQDAGGGGALAAEALPGWGVALDVPGLDAVVRRLRHGEPGVVGRVHNGRLWLHVRTLAEGELSALASRVAAALGGG